MGITVAFSYAAWVATFPEFAAVTEPQAQNYFNIATSIHRNDGGGPVTDATVQSSMLNMLTAHVAKLFWAPAGVQPSPLVGRISNASEGSVSVSTEMPTMPTSSAWFTQTQYGLMYWQMAAPYRTMIYIPNNQSPVNPGASGLWGLGGDGSGWVG